MSLEVKSSLTPSTARDAIGHLLDLKPLLEGQDAPTERYKMYLPDNFFSAVVFFELRKEQGACLAALLRSVCASSGLRGFFGGIILRGERKDDGRTGQIVIATSETPIELNEACPIGKVACE